VIVALTGVPGAGKSSVAEELSRRGYRIIGIEELLDGAGEGYDEGSGSEVVDVERVNKNLLSLAVKDCVIEGHLAHELDVDVVIVLRARPEIIEKRLRERGYGEEKVAENAEAEAIDVITIEALEKGEGVYEIDGSDMDLSTIADSIEQIMKGNGENFRPGRIDFSSYVLERF